MSAYQPVDIAAAIRTLRRVKGPMPGLIRRHGPPELRPTRNAFASLGRAIVYQQLSGKAAGTIYRRFLELFPGRRFPTPAALLAVPLEALRSVGLSGAKASYLRDLALRFSDGTVKPRRLRTASESDIVEMLIQVKGIGRWSVDMFLIFGLCRGDVLPVGDLGVRKGMQQYFALDALPGPAQMEALAAPWQPYRSVASWYMWRLIEDGLP